MHYSCWTLLCNWLIVCDMMWIWWWLFACCSGGRELHAHRWADVGAVVGTPRAARDGDAAWGRLPLPGWVRLLRLRPCLQAQVLAEESPEVGVRQGAAVSMPALRLPRKAEDAHCPPHGAHAPREGLPQTRAGIAHRQHRRLYITCVNLNNIHSLYFIISMKPINYSFVLLLPLVLVIFRCYC